ncbi:MAG TPA: DUF3787 domain-containing protein [Clostridiales bacterium]|nr:DUF3787 domain-containing protein [Clostridiales bacterium]
MGKEKNKSKENKRYSNTITGRFHGTYETLAIADSSERYEKTNVAKPSDEQVEEGREWVIHNKK